jgi:flagellar hook-length control protein FliK
MNTPLSLVTGGTSSPLNVAISTEGGGVQLSVNGSEPIDFQQILSGEQNAAEILDLLRAQLTPEQFSQIQELMEGGKPLPLAAIFSQLLQEAGADGTVTITGSESEIPATDEDLQTLQREFLAQLLQWKESQQQADSDEREESELLNLPPLFWQVDTPSSQPHKDPAAITATGEAAGVKTAAEGVALLQPVVASVETPSAANVNALAGAAVSQPQPAGNPAAPTQMPLPTVNIPPGTPGWDQAVGERIAWMVNGDIQAASIQIKPPHLGPLHIQLSIQNDQATIHFTTHHGVVKEALEAAIPRLREMLAENGGLQLVNVDVSQRDPNQTAQGDLANAYRQGGGGDSYSGGGELPLEHPTIQYRSNGLIDDYA